MLWYFFTDNPRASLTKDCHLDNRVLTTVWYDVESQIWADHLL